jgi:GT2 family glycosyltransferase
MSEAMLCSIIITNFNGRQNLEECLPGVMEAAAEVDGTEINIVDDASTDDSVSFIKRAYPQVNLLQNKSNEGFGKTANKGFHASRGKIAVLLSNDIKPDKNFLLPLLPHFKDEKLFAVGCKRLSPEGKIEEGQKVAKFLFGRVKFSRHFAWSNSYKELVPSFYTGGFGAFNREAVLALGGFHPLYAPFFWEDVDLCYRAAKRGWKVLYEPRSIVYHFDSKLGTIRRHFDSKYTKKIKKRNELLFIWSNLDRPRLLEHTVFLFVRLSISWVWGDFSLYTGFFHACMRFSEVQAKRKSNLFCVSDKDAFSLVSGHP